MRLRKLHLRCWEMIKKSPFPFLKKSVLHQKLDSWNNHFSFAKIFVLSLNILYALQVDQFAKMVVYINIPEREKKTFSRFSEPLFIARRLRENTFSTIILCFLFFRCCQFFLGKCRLLLFQSHTPPLQKDNGYTLFYYAGSVSCFSGGYTPSSPTSNRGKPD